MIPNIQCLNLNFSIYSFTIIFVFFIIWFFYNKNKQIGIYFTLLSMIIACFSPLLTNYGPSIMIKIMFVTIFSLLLSLSLNYTCINISSVLTNLFRLNILCMIITVKELWIILLLILTTITTPIVSVHNGKVHLRSVLLPVNVWVVFSSITLLFAYLFNIFFCDNIYFVILALLIPMIIHFTVNQYVEARLIFLCLLIWFNLLQNNNKSYEQIIEKFKYN